MQTLPLTIWGLTPTEGTPGQAAKVEAGFEGILAETLPQSDLKTAEILGEDGLEAGSIGPIAHDQELDQAADSQTSSDLIALVMSLGQPTASSAQNETQIAAAEFAVISAASAIPSSDQNAPELASAAGAAGPDLLAKKQIRTPSPEIASLAPTREAATKESIETPAAAPLQVESGTSAAGHAWQSGQTVAPIFSTPSQPQPEPDQPSSVWSVDAAKAAIHGQSKALESGKVDSGAVRNPIADVQDTYEVIETPIPAEAGATKAPTAAPASSTAAFTQEPSIGDASALEPAESTVEKPVQRSAQPEAPPKAESTVQPNLQPDVQRKVQLKANPVEAASEETASPSEAQTQTRTAASPAPAEASSVSSGDEAPTAHAVEQTPQTPEAEKAPQAKSKIDVPSFVHQTDPVSQMLTDRWVAWVKQNYQGADAPKISAQTSFALPASLNTAFNVTIQDGQVHLDLPKPTVEAIEPALQAAAADAVKTITALMAGSGEEEVQVETGAPIQIDPAAVTANPLAKKVLAGSAKAEKAPEAGSADEEAEAAPESNSTSDQIIDEPVITRTAAPAKEAVNPVIRQSLVNDSEDVAGSSSGAGSTSKVWTSERKTNEVELPKKDSAESLTPIQTSQAVGPIKSPAPALTPEKQEQAVIQTREALQNLVAQGRNQVTTIRLNPDDLGSLTVTIKKTGRKVEAEISASMESVRQALTNQKHELAQAVESKGALLTQLVVKSEASADASPNGQFAQNSQAGDGQAQKESQQEAARFSRLTASQSTTSTEAPASTQTGRARRTSRFDLTA